MAVQRKDDQRTDGPVTLRVMASNRVWDWVCEVLPELGVAPVRCTTPAELFSPPPDVHIVGLLDWAQADGLLGDDHRRELRALCKLLPLMLVVPREWLQVMTAEDLGVKALMSKPLEAYELAAKVRWLGFGNMATITSGA